MLKLTGAALIIIASIGIGLAMSDSLRNRLRSVEALAGFVDYVSINIQLYRTPLEDIYKSFDDKYLAEKEFIQKLDSGVYSAARNSGLLRGDEEDDIIRAFSEKIGRGSADDMVKLCSYTCVRLRNIEEKLRRELPDKQRVYRTISALAGASVVIMLI